TLDHLQNVKLCLNIQDMKNNLILKLFERDQYTSIELRLFSNNEETLAFNDPSKLGAFLDGHTRLQTFCYNMWFEPSFEEDPEDFQANEKHLPSLSRVHPSLTVLDLSIRNPLVHFGQLVDLVQKLPKLKTLALR